jgi:hypothetical protein
MALPQTIYKRGLTTFLPMRFKDEKNVNLLSQAARKT